MPIFITKETDISSIRDRDGHKKMRKFYALERLMQKKISQYSSVVGASNT